MRSLLARQMAEKQSREAQEKALNDEQAVIWKTDKQNYELEEQRLSRKINEINKQNQTFLQRQMHDKASRSNARRMNKEEFAYNKHLLREINDKRKASNYESQSRAGEEEEGN
jgi:phage shock protein A